MAHPSLDAPGFAMLDGEEVPLRCFSPLRALALVLIAGLAGCTYPVKRHDWSAYDGPGAALLHREEPPPPAFPDPLEPGNRTIAAANYGLLRGVVDPLAYGYRFLVPRPVRASLLHFSENVLYPRRLLTNLLQGKLQGAWDETKRFAVNTTVGVLGFFDPATRWGIAPSDEDFGQVFAAWGWQPSTFVSLPFFGPSTLRDGVGLVPDSLTNPISWLPFGPALAVNGALTFNEQSDLVRSYVRLAQANFDAYDLSRMLWLVDREKRVTNYRPKPQDTAAVQTLQAAFLTFQDPSFPERLRSGSVESASGQRLPYSYRLQPDPAPLVFLVPGLGAHRLDGSSLALAELVYDRGFSVVIVSDPMNFEFIEKGLRAPVPGYVPVDSQDLHVALDRVDADVARRHPGRVTARVLMGYSLGAFHALFLAARERDPEDHLLRFDRYVALDVPVRLWAAMQALDRYYDAPLAFPAAERAERIRDILKRAMEFGRGELAAQQAFSRVGAADTRIGTWQPPKELPFSDLEAQYLIGFSFRLSLQSILWVSQERKDLGVLETRRDWFHRWAAYQEMYDYGFQEYFYLFVLRYYRDDLHWIRDADEMIAACDLRALEPELRRDEKVRVFVNRNDFLRSDEDDAWLIRTFGTHHVRVFANGGHLGGLHRPEVQEEIVRSIADLLPRAR
ncbi:MAG TPA: MlaA family lipoprotein [Myxococcota bacterium]|nr:MlaA family lipoprotein [Myxococcota bacterium]